MGVDVSNSLLVGASYEELADWFDNKVQENCVGNDRYDEYDVIDEYFEQASPYFDADLEDRFFGFRVQNYQPVTNKWFAELIKQAWEFEKLTGVKPRLRGGAHVW